MLGPISSDFSARSPATIPEQCPVLPQPSVQPCRFPTVQQKGSQRDLLECYEQTALCHINITVNLPNVSSCIVIDVFRLSKAVNLAWYCSLNAVSSKYWRESCGVKELGDCSDASAPPVVHCRYSPAHVRTLRFCSHTWLNTSCRASTRFCVGSSQRQCCTQEDVVITPACRTCFAPVSLRRWLTHLCMSFLMMMKVLASELRILSSCGWEGV